MDIEKFPVGDLTTLELVRLADRVAKEINMRLLHKHGEAVDWVYSYPEKSIKLPVRIAEDSQYGISASFPGGQSIVDNWFAGIAEDFED